MTDMAALNDDAKLQQVKWLIAVSLALYVHTGACLFTVWPVKRRRPDATEMESKKHFLTACRTAFLSLKWQMP